MDFNNLKKQTLFNTFEFIIKNKFSVIAGPCSVESAEQMTRIAEAVKASGAIALRGGIFKPCTQAGIVHSVRSGDDQGFWELTAVSLYCFRGQAVAFCDLEELRLVETREAPPGYPSNVCLYDCPGFRLVLAPLTNNRRNVPPPCGSKQKQDA